MDKVLYLSDPCGTCATAFWKESYFKKPDGLFVVHEKDASEAQKRSGTAYFRLIHHLTGGFETTLPHGFAYKSVDLPQEAGLVADIINKCYEGYSLSGEAVLKWTKYPVFDQSLWVLIWDEAADAPAALGIADFDNNVAEGSLEWIQVLPGYRGQGLGRMVVNELLSRLKGQVDFVTVSGQVDNTTNPQGLYRRCGFVGDDIWYVGKN
ncbi:MAG: GNAT family N-acetyltransferase [Defluviitaleaceae bacterium]|nr:GNAT family N-acetyltransferase [Defluviitaleaceae bacterium]